jgi:ABC-type nitrate/sulfonate/bicarbonate transport system permease component
MTLARVGWYLASFMVGAAVIAGWQVASDLRLVSPVFLPGPDRAWDALVRGFGDGELPTRFAHTVERMICGWLLASIAGIAIGSAIGISRTASAYLTPMLEFIRPLPAAALVPLAIAVLGLSEAMVLTVIAFGALWPVLLATIHGFATIEPRLIEVARLLGLGRWQFIGKVALPNAVADIVAGMRISLTIALILTVLGEMLGSRDGLGLWILQSARSFRSADLFAGVMVFGIIGYVTGQVMSVLEARVLRWRATA